MTNRPDVIETISAARHVLFVPGNRPDRFDKAVASGADLAILDLEDAVAPADKDTARAAVRQWLDAGGRAMVRINAADTAWFADDAELAGHPNLIGIMFPKAFAGDRALAAVAARAPVLALVESAKGAADPEALACMEGVVRLALGTIDLALDLDMTGTAQESDRAFDPLRLRLAIASRAAGIAPPVDSVAPDFRDADACEAAMRRARALGFAAKMCIHPAQLAAVTAALAPTEAELERARRIVAADEASGGSAVALDGAMIDRPVVERARRLLRFGSR